jgi:hypothetical protein
MIMNLRGAIAYICRHGNSPFWGGHFDWIEKIYKTNCCREREINDLAKPKKQAE